MVLNITEIKNCIRIELDTGRAVIPDSEDAEKPVRMPDMNKDYYAIQSLLRRMLVIDAMDTIMRYANHEDIVFEWLTLGVADGTDGIYFYDYVDDNTYFETVELFKSLITEYEIDDITY